jgi:serine protease
MRSLTAFLAALVFLVVAAPQARASNDPLFGELWNLQQTGAPSAWAVSTGGVRVGIVDTGVDAGHPDLSGHVADATDCLAGSSDPNTCSGNGDDVNGHGTHVAGIIAATKDNGEGVAGTAPSAQLVVARVFDSGGRADIRDITAGALWVIQHGARVVNLSLGDAGLFGSGLFVSNSDVRNLAATIWNNGAIPVVAAGNNNCAGWSGTNAVVVAALGPQRELANYSCTPQGAQWGIAAPGGDDSDGSCPNGANCVLSTYARNKTPAGKLPYAYLEGTSMAAPAVTGALADLLAKGLSRDAAISTLLSSADPASCGSGCQGALNVARAVCGGTCPVSTGNTAPPPTSPVQKIVHGTPTTVKPKPKPAPAVAAVTPPTTVPPTTEAPTTTSSSAPTPSDPVNQLAGAPKKTSDNDGAAPVAIALAIAGLLAAGGATGLAFLRGRARAGVEL